MCIRDRCIRGNYWNQHESLLQWSFRCILIIFKYIWSYTSFWYFLIKSSTYFHLYMVKIVHNSFCAKMRLLLKRNIRCFITWPEFSTSSQRAKNWFHLKVQMRKCWYGRYCYRTTCPYIGWNTYYIYTVSSVNFTQQN